VELLSVHDRDALERFGFPRAQETALLSVIRSAEALAVSKVDEDVREAVRIVLAKLAFTCPIVAGRANATTALLRRADQPPARLWEPDLGPPRPASARARAECSIVSRILRDLRAA
jgi:hypothetical protein